MAAFVSSFTGVRSSFTGGAIASHAVSPCRFRMAASKAIPFMESPPKLDGSRPGDYGFDPLYMSENMDQDWAAAAELKNGRVAMLATVGFVVQELVHLPAASFSEPNPLKAIYAVPTAGWFQIIVAVCLIELATFKKTFTVGGQLGFDPLGVGSRGNLRDWQVREVINARLAMLGIIGFIAQTLKTGKPVIAQLTGLFG